VKEALDDDGRARAASEVCGGGVSARETRAEFGISRPVGYEWPEQLKATKASPNFGRRSRKRAWKSTE
jgi:transposase